MTPRVREAAAAYRCLGSTKAVAEALGVSMQRAAQLLHRAADEGGVEYEPRPTIRKLDARKALRETGTISGAARALGVSARTFVAKFPDLAEALKAKRIASVDEEARRVRIAYMANRRANAKREGVCVRCFRRNARKQFVLCAPCAEDDRARSKARALRKSTPSPE